MEITKRKHNLDMGIITLWLHWVFATGALVLPMFIGLLLPKMWMPVFILIEIIAIYYYIQTNAEKAPRCYLVLNVCAKSLILAAIIMFVLNWMHSSGYINEIFDPRTVNPGIPYIGVLVIAPCSLLFSIIDLLRGNNITFCQNCVRRYGSTAERGFIGLIYKREGRLQLMLLAVLSAVIVVCTWGYYFFAYINVNFNRPDLFFFIGLPSVTYVLSLIYTALRYSGLLTYYSIEFIGSARQRGAITQLRFIVSHDDSVFIAPVDPALGSKRLDSPFDLTLRYRKDIPLEIVTYDFCNIANVKTAKLKYLYTSESGNLDGTIRHYLAVLDNRDDLDTSAYPGGRWVSFYELKVLANASRLAPLLAAEVARIYTITMAWKTYDNTGHRLYKVKNYRPSFRLSQLLDLDVDYNDNRWLFIAANNQDKRGWRIKRFFNRLKYGRKL